jgi:uncharacterized protein (DUF885 family)
VVVAGAAALIARRGRAADYAAALADAYGDFVEPIAMHELAKREAARLQARADRLLGRLGLAHGPVAERLQAFAADPSQLYPDSPLGRRQALADMNGWLARTRPLMAPAFAGLPLPEPEVRAPAPQDADRGGYREPPAYYVDLRNIRARPRWSLPSVAFHETVPGHAIQAAVQGRPRPGSFPEAWAVYAEQLMADLGAYAGEPAAELGYLHWRLFRIGRIVADTGQGELGWSLDQAVTALRELQGIDAAFVTIEADAARMRARPGMYAAQGLGALAIRKARPGRRGRWPAFHRAILADGPWPCAMLS